MPETLDRSETAVRPSARRAALWMLGAVVGAAPLPLIIWAGVRTMSPFFLVAVWYLTRAVVQSLLRQVQERRHKGRAVPSKQGVKRLAIAGDLDNIKRQHLWAAVACKSNWLLFALAVTLVDPVVVTVTHEFWPLFFGLVTLTGFWGKRMLGGRPPRLRGVGSMLMLLLVGGVGVSLVVVSDEGVSSWSETAPLGLVVALLSALLTAVGAGFEQLMGSDRRETGEVPYTDSTALSASGNAIAQVIAAPAIALVGVLVLLGGSSDGWSANGCLFAMLAGVAFAVSDWCWQHANHLSRTIHGKVSAQINALYYLTPICALLLLVWFADTRIGQWEMFVGGVGLVLSANLFLYLKAGESTAA